MGKQTAVRTIGGRERIISYPEKKRRPKLHKPPGVIEHHPPGVSILPLPDREPMVLFTDDVDEINLKIVEQHTKVNLEKSMIKDQTNVPASLSNKVGKVWIGIKQKFHREAPRATTLTKRTEMENRTLGDTYKQFGPGAVIAGIIILYLITKGK